MRAKSEVAATRSGQGSKGSKGGNEARAAARSSHGYRGNQRFDAFRLAASGDVLEGVSDARTLSRVVDRLVPGTGSAEIQWRIRGGHDADGRPALVVTLNGAVPLTCQRCLQPFSLPVAQETVLLLARDEAELAHLDNEDAEVVLANAQLIPQDLVEDELLLSLPFVPRHPDEECATIADGTGPDTNRNNAATEAKVSPFASLSRPKARQ